MSLAVDYASAGFDGSTGITPGPSSLVVTWDELLWAALTVGRPNRHYVFRHGAASVHEALFRMSLVRMALEQRGLVGRRLVRTDVAKTLDPSEKGAVNYFLGMAMTRLFASRCLGVHRLFHLDLFRTQLGAVLTGRARPDLVGQDEQGRWISFESKGRTSKPSQDVKDKAKQQAGRIVSINGQAPVMCIGAISYFKGDVLRFFWEDPVPSPENVKRPIRLTVPPGSWRVPYMPLLDLILVSGGVTGRLAEGPRLTPIPGLDLAVGIRPDILKALLSDAAPDSDAPLTSEAQSRSNDNGWTYQPDGVAVISGDSWRQPAEARLPLRNE